ncbi:MAG: metallophosphoesterase family protein [Thermoanaerobaculia bacterium]|nr:metallophosphoesterase family protein [Thermoanaerobaculia bacterium]
MRQILHISDIHFGPPHLPRVAEGVAALAAEGQPDLVVMAGDATQRAKPRQFRAARRWVDRLGAPVVEIPGNHDVPMYRFWERIFAPYRAYRRHYRSELRMTWSDDELGVVALNTAHGWTVDNGRLTSAELAWACRRLDELPPELCRVVVIHHPLIPPPRFPKREILRGARRAVERFAAAGVELVLGGHLHQAYAGTSDQYYPEHLPSMVVAHAGTATSDRGRGSERGRNTLNWVTVEEGWITVEHRLWRPADERFVTASSHRFRRPRKADLQ